MFILKPNTVEDQSKPLFPPSRLSVHMCVLRTYVCHKIFFSLKSPWNHPLTPGVDPRGLPRVPPGHTAPREARIF